MPGSIFLIHSTARYKTKKDVAYIIRLQWKAFVPNLLIFIILYLTYFLSDVIFFIIC